MGAIRGAICAQNTIDDISAKSIELVEEIMRRNNLSVGDIECVIFSVTDDLTVCYPAKAVRERFKMNQTAFMCLAEMKVDGALDHCIRVLVNVPTLRQADCKHCYLGQAECLRKDL